MRIGVIVGDFPKLSETFILTQITGLLDLGHDVDIYARDIPHECAGRLAVLDWRLHGHNSKEAWTPLRGLL